MAFHDGGVAKCESCHTMHNSNAGVQMNANVGAYLLQGSDQSSACLNCHGKGSTLSGYHVKTQGVGASGVPANFTPGGDFSWTMIDCQSNATRNSARGHNIISLDQGMPADSRLTAAPGGTYPAANLACSSCHDPHGKYRVDEAGTVATSGAPISSSGSYGAAAGAGEAVGAYRILGGVGYLPKSLADAGLSANAFANTVPAAVAPSSYNTAVAGGARVAYGSGMSEWCANCHSNFHQTGQASASFGAHPAGNGYKLGAAVAANYNAYVSSGKMTGDVATSNSNLVPFEAGLGQSVADKAAMVALVTATTGPDANANVMCLSCHRAHASGHESMLRWNQGNTLLTDGAGLYSVEPGLADQAVNVASYQNVPSATFGAEQRSLCNKCHAKD
ncbi:MAG: cytochrome C [Pseudomonadota bacterium]